MLSTDEKHFTQCDIDAATVKLCTGIRQFIAQNFKVLRKLQSAPRNRGVVYEMEGGDFRGHFASVAVKQMPTAWVGSDPEEFARKHPGELERPWVDIALLKLLNDQCCPHVCDLLGIYRSRTCTYFVTSLATYGDLHRWCVDSATPEPGPALEQMAKPIAREIFSAVSWLHSLGVAHGDLSLENILLTTGSSHCEFEVKVIDFGMSTMSRHRTGLIGKKIYRAPEIHTGEVYDSFLADSFAIGAVLLTMTTKRYPWNNTKPGGCDLFEFVRVHGIAQYLNGCQTMNGRCHFERLLSQPFRDLMSSFAAVAPTYRLHMREANVASMQWLGSFNDERGESTQSIPKACSAGPSSPFVLQDVDRFPDDSLVPTPPPRTAKPEKFTVRQPVSDREKSPFGFHQQFQSELVSPAIVPEFNCFSQVRCCNV
eukprot:TRINITY_DN69318_c0_g1_i1.p1 TRINITY_DN69318_c0_g1~~TRINITY_DN69318_c0_g1_i1.p1  ORF type:complete len:425 (-),score=48.53 TRINITY_DN69318_c0_g1_i1:318-1592(-)